MAAELEDEVRSGHALTVAESVSRGWRDDARGRTGDRP
jgi:hypothetical protein